MRDFKIMLSNIGFHLTESFGKLMGTIVRCIAIFLVWTITVFSIGVGITLSIKFLMWSFNYL